MKWQTEFLQAELDAPPDPAAVQMLIGMLEDAVMGFEDVMQDDKAPNSRACSTADATQASSSASKLALACELARAMDTLICGSSRHAEVLSLEGESIKQL